MKKAKRLIVLAAVLLMLVSGAVTVYAMTEDQARERAGQTIPSEYAAEEMAVGAYYENWTPETDAGPAGLEV